MRIVEILRRSEQGVTQPFICRGEDESLYYVKGRHAGYEALCREWVAGELARGWDLPVAPFCIVEIPEALVRGSLMLDAVELWTGPAFGSREVDDTVELRWNEVQSDVIPELLRAKILIFDWWVGNTDRVLGETGGNANLLWSAHDRRLTVIDHNLAFSYQQMPKSFVEFCSDHVFGSNLMVDQMYYDKSDGLVPSALMSAAWDLRRFWQQDANFLNDIWAELPEVWVEGAPDITNEATARWLSSVEKSDFGYMGEPDE